VTEVHTGLQHIAHVDLGHDSSLISRVWPPRIPMTNQWHQAKGTQVIVSTRVWI
jgi:hypothetical protein